MSLCPECGNILVVQSCSPVCLVCQHTGRGKVMPADFREPNPNPYHSELVASGMAAALDAVYKALEPTPEETFLEAQQMLRHRIRNPEHNRERPNWDEIDVEERERQEVCQTCLGTRRYLTFPCPDCSEDGDRERD